MNTFLDMAMCTLIALALWLILTSVAEEVLNRNSDHE